MLRRWILSLLLGLAIFGVIAWWLDVWPGEGNTSPRGKTGDGKTGDVHPVIGADLYKPEAPPPRQGKPGARRAEPIVIPDCHLVVVFQQFVPSQRDGQLLVVGSPISEIEAKKLSPALAMPIEVPEETGTAKKWFRVVRDGDR